ncbi:MAG TPA: cytochrome c biogenesis protein CcdA [Dongiaceae bacterium]|jgi:cytochrome c-type biogenesis protein|nr:cytochrome c biogenesis protein CcdA [Dongiaceae bacterium]
MEQVFTRLGHAVEGAPLLAWAAAAAWGVLSIVLSPCHLASIPLIVGFISGQERRNPARASGIAALFALGILVTIAFIGAITAAAGRIMGDVGPWGNYFVAAVLIVVGLHLLSVISLPWDGPGPVKMKHKGLPGAFLLGLVFGIALGPCTFAYLAPLLAVTFKLAKTAPFYSTSLLVAYGIGHGVVIVLAGASTELVQRFLNWNGQSHGITMIKYICGVLVICGGVWLVYTAP